MPNPVIAWQIDTASPEELLEFYAGIFEWQVGAPGHVQYVNTDTEEGIDGSAHGLSAEDESVRLLLVVRVDDINEVLDKVKASGGTVDAEPHQVADGRTIATFRDPWGNFIRIVRLAASSTD